MLLLALAVAAAHGSLQASAPRLPLLRAARPRVAPAVRCQAAEAAAQDLVGDGGVLKTVVRRGDGPSSAHARGSKVEVHYVGTLDTGTVFDSSRQRGKTFKFTLGEGKVIGGWEVGVPSMQVGERCTLTCSPQYAYGAKGIPPMIPPSATLQFDVELLSVLAPQADRSTFADDNMGSPRTPGAIKSAYESKMAAKPEAKEGLDGFLEWAKGIYIFGLFSGTKERPPWYINPLITFPSIFVIVGVGFWLVVSLGGLHRGEVAPVGDDLASFVGETVAP